MKGRWIKFFGVTFILAGLTAKAMAMGPGMGEGFMGRPCPSMMGMGHQDGQPAFDRTKMQKFYEETKQLRAKIWQKREDLRMLYLQEVPDWSAISQKRSELVSLITELQKKAFELGIPLAFGRGMGRGCSCGRIF